MLNWFHSTVWGQYGGPFWVEFADMIADHVQQVEAAAALRDSPILKHSACRLAALMYIQAAAKCQLQDICNFSPP
jgi:hypothetical protein